METALQKRNKNSVKIAEKLPEKMELSALQHNTDLILTKGLRVLDEILDMPYEETTKDAQSGMAIIKILEPKNKISAIAQVIAVGRLLETRKLNEKEQDATVIFDTSDMVINGDV